MKGKLSLFVIMVVVLVIFFILGVYFWFFNEYGGLLDIEVIVEELVDVLLDFIIYIDVKEKKEVFFDILYFII